jgi:hypothetical protein
MAMARVTPGTGRTRTGFFVVAPAFRGFAVGGALDFIELAVGGRKLIPDDAR